jgi:hypothetical protein
MGSAGSGLGFNHIDLPKVEITSWLDIANCPVMKNKMGVMMTKMKEMRKQMLMMEMIWMTCLKTWRLIREQMVGPVPKQKIGCNL